jgi:hypothetical protein
MSFVSLRSTCLFATSIALACSAEPDDEGAASDDSGSTAPTGSSGDAATSTPTSSATTGADTTGDGPTTTGGGGSDSQGSASGTTGDATTGADTTGASEWDGEPLPPNPPGAWMWVDFPESRCRNDTSTGIGVRYGSGDNLAIYFEGGGACFNTATCLLNDGFSNFGPVQFTAWANTLGAGGIFDADAEDNPLADWSFVYVPYCTGDVHAGDKQDAGVPGVFGAQQFVGYRNVGLYLERIVPSFAGASHVLVSGQSAGGFGAAFNYDRIADAWPESKVTLLDDSGPPFGDMYLAPCMQKEWRSLWNLDDTIPADCSECFSADGGGISNLAGYLADKHAGQKFALYSSEQDAVIRTFFGFGMNNCLGGIMTGAMFQEGLYDLRDDILGDDPAWASFFAPGSNHTITASPLLYATTVDGVRLVDWIADLLAGQTAHVSP